MKAKPHRTLTPLALAVLNILAERAMHPYEMQQVIRDRGTDHSIKVRAGSLYHTVERLLRLDLIEPVQTGRAGNRPERTVYAITETGRDEYLANLRDLVRYPEEEFPVFGAAMEMLHTLRRAEVLRLLIQRCTALEAMLAGYEQVAASLTKRGLPRLAIVELEYAVAMHRAELGWINQLIDDIQSGELPWTTKTEEPPR
jgi:DNA-binding PadR family transcriptional regulator